MFEVLLNNLHSSDLVLAPVVIWLSFFHMKAPFTVEDSSSAAPKISFLQNNNNKKKKPFIVFNYPSESDL